MILVAAIGAKALYFLIVWLASAAIAGALASRKGYEDRVGLATGLVLPVLAPIAWLFWPAKERSPWRVEGPIGGPGLEADMPVGHRSPWGMAALSILTGGIFTVLWWWQTQLELAALGRRRGTEELGTRPTRSLLALFPGGILIVPVLVTYFNGTTRLEKAAHGERTKPVLGRIPLFVLYLVLAPLYVGLYQASMNRIAATARGYAPAGADPVSA